MKYLFFLFLIPFFLIAAETPLSQIEGCVTKNESSAVCSQVASFLKTHPLHWEGSHWYLEDEWKFRQRLSSEGIALKEEQVPAEIVTNRMPNGELLVVFFPWPFEGSESSSRPFVLGEKAGLQVEGLDPGMFPISEAHLYFKKAGEKTWRFLQKIPADTLVPKNKTQAGERDLAFWFPSLQKAQCPTTKDLFKNRVGICFSHFYSQQWPEIHTWKDELGSEGVRMNTYVYDGKQYQRLHEGLGHFQKAQGNWVFVSIPEGEGYDATWAYLSGGKVFERKGNSMRVNAALSRKLFPARKVKIGTPGYPTRAGLFFDKKGERVEMVPSAP